MLIRRGLAVLAVLVGLAVIIGPSLTSAADPSLTSAADPSLPADFVAVSPGSGVQETMASYSSTTGGLTQRLATFGESFTNNGLAVTPDRSAVYFTLIPPHSGQRFGLRIMRLDVATRRQTFIAEGAQPAVSDDGTQLAYGAASHGLAVRDLASGTTRTLGLVTQLGPAADLLNAAVTWLADGSDVAIVPSPPLWDLVGRPPSSKPRGSCRFSARGAVVVFVHVPPPPGLLSARCVHIPGPAPVAETVAGDAAAPTSLLLANFGGRRTNVERVAVAGTITRLLGLGGSLPLAIDRSGAHILYLVGSSPPALWEATIADGRLTAKRRLIANSKLGPAAW